jgi:hypothetical protein
MFASHLGQIIDGQSRAIPKWFVKRRDELRQSLQGLGSHHKLVVIGAKVFGNQARVCAFVVRFFFETYAKGLYWLAGNATHVRDDEARVNSTAQKRSKWHIGNHS